MRTGKCVGDPKAQLTGKYQCYSTNKCTQGARLSFLTSRGPDKVAEYDHMLRSARRTLRNIPKAVPDDTSNFNHRNCGDCPLIKVGRYQRARALPDSPITLTLGARHHQMARINDKQFLATLLEPTNEKEPQVELLRSGEYFFGVSRPWSNAER